MNISNHNDALLAGHNRRLDFLKSEVNLPAGILQKLKDFQIAIPSWALGTGGTRFGRFSGGGEPRNLEEKIADVGLLHALNQQLASGDKDQILTAIDAINEFTRPFAERVMDQAISVAMKGKSIE